MGGCGEAEAGLMRWTSREIAFLEEHAHEGAEAIARSLGRSVTSVQRQASNYGISLKRRWHCPSCGRWIAKPPSRRTGWCSACTKARQREKLEEEARELERQVMREKEENRKRQAIYSKKNRLRNASDFSKKPSRKTQVPAQGIYERKKR